MLNTQQKIKFSEHAVLYDILIPKDNKYRLIDELIDFSFIYDELKDKYCPDNGRTAADPIMLFKYLMIKAIENLSDVDVVEHSRYDLSYKRFLGLMPEDDVIDPSLLTKFRRLRLKDVNLLDMLIGKTVRVALEKGIIKTKTIIVDATHTISRANALSPIDVLKLRSKEVRNRICKWPGNEGIDLPALNDDDDLMHELDSCEALLSIVMADPVLCENPAFKESINYLAEGVDDVRHHHSISHDREARVGHKSAETSFLGYKTHIAMSPERIITAACVTTGEKSDGTVLPEIVQKTKDNGIEVDAIVGDAAYSGRDNLAMGAENGIQIVAKLNGMITQGHVESADSFKDRFTYNKDADRYVCPAGIMAHKKDILVDKRDPNKNYRIRYRWSAKECGTCALKEECLNQAKYRTLRIRVLSKEHQEQLMFQKTERFKLLSKQRYKIEAKNSELKNAHGYDRADSYGISAMELQGAVTIFVVNLKRIMKMMAK